MTFTGRAQRFSGLLLALVIFSSATHAQNKVQKELISKELQRPTATEILSEAPDTLATVLPNNTGLSNHVIAIRNGLPELIATLEKAFPNGIYGFLGRDTSLVANGMEAVYFQYGQSDRVKYINLSTPIFSAMTPTQLALYIKSLGLSDSKVSDQPFILIDRTSYNGVSQSNKVTNAVTAYLKGLGFSNDEIVQRFNVVTIDGNRTRPLQLTDAQIQATKLQQANELNSFGKIQTIFSTTTNLGTMAYSSEWHNTFATVRTGSDGVPVPVPIAYTENYRVLAYQEILNLLGEVTTPQYLTNLEVSLKNYGIDIAANADPVKIAEAKERMRQERAKYKLQTERDGKVARLAQEQRAREDKQKLQKARKELVTNAFAKLASTLSPLPEHEVEMEKGSTQLTRKIRLSKNGNEFAQVYANAQTQLQGLWGQPGLPTPYSPLTEVSLVSLMDLYDQGKLSDRDFRRLFEVVLMMPAHSNQIPENIEKILEARVQTSRGLRYIFGTEKMREEFPREFNVPQMRAMYDRVVAKTGMGLACEYIYK